VSWIIPGVFACLIAFTCLALARRAQRGLFQCALCGKEDRPTRSVQLEIPRTETKWVTRLCESCIRKMGFDSEKVSDL